MVHGVKLGGEPGILAPKEPNVRDLVQPHGQPLQAESKGKSDLVISLNMALLILLKKAVC